MVEIIDKVKEKLKDGEEKGKATDLEDEFPKLEPPLQEEKFFKSIKVLGGKTLEGVPLFMGKMGPDLVMEWIEDMENHIDC